MKRKVAMVMLLLLGSAVFVSSETAEEYLMNKFITYLDNGQHEDEDVVVGLAFAFLKVLYFQTFHIEDRDSASVPIKEYFDKVFTVELIEAYCRDMKEDYEKQGRNLENWALVQAGRFEISPYIFIYAYGRWLDKER